MAGDEEGEARNTSSPTASSAGDGTIIDDFSNSSFQRCVCLSPPVIAARETLFVSGFLSFRGEVEKNNDSLKASKTTDSKGLTCPESGLENGICKQISLNDVPCALCWELLYSLLFSIVDMYSVL
ncbi:uncharacterized protein LOC103716256 isoform X3 [Phoenix dactylifera]|uniref:Uncharacterized protein LOC103716256 isoform X3 n=1 Tax=Phoenix dactylifera TaxID=42345 RepID=A0A8B8ZMV8_PHODC|nr:uncharacterized protein LOC103716256 isoform X3 [Phoenix dactylifera]